VIKNLEKNCSGYQTNSIELVKCAVTALKESKDGIEEFYNKEATKAGRGNSQKLQNSTK
jgi:hypothetical protein